MSSPTPRAATVLVYASDERVREAVRLALGRRPAPGVEVEIEEASTGAGVIARCDQGGLDLVVLDGEAAPTGGLGLCRQIKDEIDPSPPVLVLIGRRDDAWLATWSRADAVVPHPLDALQLSEAVVSLLGRSSGVLAPGH